jgi:hypothetical protein
MMTPTKRKANMSPFLSMTLLMISIISGFRFVISANF